MFVKELAMAISRFLMMIVLLGMVVSIRLVVRADNGIFPSEENDSEIDSLKSKVVLLENALKTKEASLTVKGLKINELERELKNLHFLKDESQDHGLIQQKIQTAESKARGLQDQLQVLQEESRKLREEVRSNAEKAKFQEETATLLMTDKKRVIKSMEARRIRLQRAERGLQIAESAMLRAKTEAEEKFKKLNELHQAWLPLWASTHAEFLQKTASSCWSTHGEPVLKILHKSASSKAADAHEFVKPHLETFQTQVNLFIRQTWQQLTEAVAPHLETVKKTGIQSRKYIVPHVETVQRSLDPYVKSAKEKSEPHVEKVSTFAASYLERVNTLAGPHYRQPLTAANNYHDQLQSNLRGHLEQYEFLSHFVTKESIWFLAAAILALPFMPVFMFLKRLFTRKQVMQHKRHRSSHSGTSSTYKKPPRSRQADKLMEK